MSTWRILELSNSNDPQVVSLLTIRQPWSFVVLQVSSFVGTKAPEETIKAIFQGLSSGTLANELNDIGLTVDPSSVAAVRALLGSNPNPFVFRYSATLPSPLLGTPVLTGPLIPFGMQIQTTLAWYARTFCLNPSTAIELVHCGPSLKMEQKGTVEKSMLVNRTMKTRVSQ